MPRLDGLEAIRVLRSDRVTAAIPIIALTALAMPGDRERCLAAWANGYFRFALADFFAARCLPAGFDAARAGLAARSSW